MNVKIHVEQTMLDDLDLTTDQFADAAGTALGVLTHPETGEPIYINGGLRVTVVADLAE